MSYPKLLHNEERSSRDDEFAAPLPACPALVFARIVGQYGPVPLPLKHVILDQVRDVVASWPELAGALRKK